MNIYWIGSRESDVFEESLFYGSLTRYGDDNSRNISFCNNNYTDNYHEFVKKELMKLLEKDPESRFIFADELNAYKYGRNIFEHSLCLNSFSAITALGDKIFTRNFISKVANIPECIVLNGSSAKNVEFVQSLFYDNHCQFVIQSAFGAGGEHTEMLNTDLKSEFKTMQHVLITQYIEEAIPINVHIAISNKEYRIFPPSIQLVFDTFKYSGSDYIAILDLDIEQRKQIYNTCENIAKRISQLHCNGILGVDLLLSNNTVFFLECNYRYQGSSFLLNQALRDNGLPSYFKIQYNAFYDSISEIPQDIFWLPIKYSSFRRTKDTEHIELRKPFFTKFDGDISTELHQDFICYDIFKESIFKYLKK